MNNIQMKKINNAIGNAVLIVIGINCNNDERTFPKLTKCVNDAKGIYNVFRNQPQLNMDISRSKILINENETTKENIIDVIKNICKNISDNDNIIFFYSGHGHRFSGNDNYYIVPTNNYDSSEKSLICFEELWEIILETKAKIKLALLDACYSGSINLLKNNHASYSYQNDYINKTKGIAIISSSSADEPSNEQSDNDNYSLFTNFLINAFKGNQDSLEDGYLSIISLFNYIEKEVKKKTKEYVGVKQTPNLSITSNSKLLLGYYNNLGIYKDSPIFNNLCNIKFKPEEDILNYANDNMCVLLTDEMWNETQTLLNEIIYNISKHNKASKCFIEIGPTIIKIIDNGKFFNCVDVLSSTNYKNADGRNNGSRIYQEYIKKYKDEVDISYKYEQKFNNFEIKFKNFMAFDIKDMCMVKTINLNHMRVSEKDIIFPRGICKVYYYYLPILFRCISINIDIIKVIRNKIPKESILIVIDENNMLSNNDIFYNKIDGVIYEDE